MNWISNADRQQFRDDGFMVVRGVVPSQLIAPAVADIAAFVGADLNMPSTWYRGHLQNDGLVPMHHAQSIWNIRQCPEVHEAFSEFWGTRMLMTDINRCCFRPPCHKDWPTLSRGEIHWDADPRVPRPLALQAIVLLTDIGQNSGGFQCVPDIYRDLSNWLRKHANPKEFHHLRPGISQKNAHQVEGRAGDLILWSTLLPHGPAPNFSNRPRVAMFMTHTPPPDNAELRKQMHEWWSEKRAPTYWRGLNDQLDPEPGVRAELTPLGQRLIGFVPWSE